jgi:hypothetical protein
VALPADDDDELAALVAVALGDDDALFVGVVEADEEAEDEEDADAAGCVAAGLVQVACGLGRPDPVDGTVPLGLLLGLVVGDAVPVVVGLGLLLGLAAAVGVLVVVEVGLGLLLAPALELAVLSLLWLPLDDVAGAVVAWLALLGELLVLSVVDELGEDDPQDDVEGARTPGMLAPPGVGTGALLAPSVPLLPAELPSVKA